MDYWNSFWDVLWTMFWVFAFCAYLITLFTIIGDLFRDRDLAGWAKAIWVVCFFIFPFLSTLVYLIARGRGMAQRTVKQAEANKEASDQYIREVAGTSPSDEIAKAKGLLDAGTINADEYEKLKAAALARG